ncbi:MAG: Uma2 family endonuclease [Lachnospiraceae bacterium]|nr:Uma2 family endonuclease [Lachnospiraceae bacterium]
MSEDRLYTVRDIEALPEGERAELIDGKMYMMASPTLTHQDILMWLSARIWSYIKEQGGPCKVLPAPFAVYIKDDGHNYVEPDISVICDQDKLDEKGCHGAPDWVIEIVSPSSKTMDYIRKCALYEAAGVREYWIVDPMERNVKVYNFECGTWRQYTFSERVKVGIYEDFFLDFGETA